jgi:hypothetical protein
MYRVVRSIPQTAQDCPPGRLRFVSCIQPADELDTVLSGDQSQTPKSERQGVQS